GPGGPYEQQVVAVLADDVDDALVRMAGDRLAGEGDPVRVEVAARLVEHARAVGRLLAPDVDDREWQGERARHLGGGVHGGARALRAVVGEERAADLLGAHGRA